TRDEIICDSKIPLHFLNNTFNTHIPEEEDNLAGFILNEFEAIPEIGDTMTHDNLTFEIMEAEERKINTVRITKSESKNEEDYKEIYKKRNRLSHNLLRFFLWL